MIVYISAFLSPHVKPFCDFLYEKTNGDFKYIETIKLTEERKAMGYSYTDEDAPYLMQLEDNVQTVKEIIDTAECAIINPCSSDSLLVKNRLSNNLTTFFISERIFKKGLIKVLDPRVWKLFSFLIGKKNKPLYLLCMGGFVAKDFCKLGFSEDKLFKFGYFPESAESNKKEIDTNNKIEICWVGRMIDWKRPSFAVEVVEKLVNDGIDCHLSMCGDGPLMEATKKFAEEKKVESYIDFCGMQKNEKVREIMASSTVLLSTSTRMEGWGAVLNEAIDVGTPIVAYEDVGAAPYLIKNGYNGYTFKTDSVKEAVDGIKKIYSQKNTFRKNALETSSLWNNTVASERFWEVLEDIRKGKIRDDKYESGPMSKEIV